MEKEKDSRRTRELPALKIERVALIIMIIISILITSGCESSTLHKASCKFLGECKEDDNNQVIITTQKGSADDDPAPAKGSQRSENINLLMVKGPGKEQEKITEDPNELSDDRDTVSEEGSEEEKKKVFYVKNYPIENFIQYREERFSIKYPDYWNAIEDYYGADVVLISPRTSVNDKFSENVNIMIQDQSETGWDLDTYTIFSFHEVRDNLDNGFVLETKNTKLSGHDGRYIGYLYKDGDLVLRGLAVYTLFENKSYLITYTAEEKEYDNYMDTFEKMVDSFRIV